MTAPAEYLFYDWAELPPIDPWQVLGRGYYRDKAFAAEHYAKLGLHPILLHGLTDDGRCTCRRDCDRSRGKHPVHGKWQAESLDVGDLLASLARQPLFNIGLRTGKQPNGRVLLVLDIDGAIDLLNEWQPDIEFPPTLTARTGRGGTHLYYYLPAGETAGNTAGLLARRAKAEGQTRPKELGDIDSRCEGGQVACAPSLHYSGNRYTWINCVEPAELAL